MLLLTRKNRIKELWKRPPFDSTKWKEIADIFNVRIDYVMGLDRIDPEHYQEEGMTNEE